MSSSPSLALLKGGQKKLIEEELEAAPAPAPKPTLVPAAEKEPTLPVDVVEEEIQVDIESLDEAGVSDLITKYGIAVPDTWGDYSLEQKRVWMLEQFSEEEGAEDEPTLPPDEETTGEAVASQPAAEPAEPAKAEETAQVPATTGKKGSKKATKKAAPPAEIVETDVIIDVVSEIEHLTREGALNLVHQLTEETEITYFRLGGALSVVMRNEWFKPDYPTFRDYVEQVYGMAYRRAAYWVAIYNALSESGIPWAKVKDVGWTKLKEIAQVLTQENVDEWVQRALSMNTQNLIAAVKAAQNDGTPKALEDANAKATVSKTFKLHTDQVAALDAAIAKAKGQTDTTVDTVALQYICEDFVGSMSMEERIKKLGIEKLLKMIENVFPDVDLQLSVK